MIDNDSLKNLKHNFGQFDDYSQIIKFIDDEHIITLSSNSNALKVINIQTNNCTKYFKIDSEAFNVRQIAVSNKHNIVVICTLYHFISFYNLNTGQKIELNYKKDNNDDFAIFTKNNKYLVIAGSKSLKILDLEQNEIINSIQFNNNTNYNYTTWNIDFNYDQSKILIRYSTDNTEELLVLEFPSLNIITKLIIEDSEYYEIDYFNSPGSINCFFGDRNDNIYFYRLESKNISIFDIKSNKIIENKFSVKSEIRNFCVSPDKSKMTIIFDYFEPSVSIWDTNSRKKLIDIKKIELEWGVPSLDISPDCSLFGITSDLIEAENADKKDSNNLFIFDLKNGKLVNKYGNKSFLGNKSPLLSNLFVNYISNNKKNIICNSYLKIDLDSNISQYIDKHLRKVLAKNNHYIFFQEYDSEIFLYDLARNIIIKINDENSSFYKVGLNSIKEILGINNNKLYFLSKGLLKEMKVFEQIIIFDIKNEKIIDIIDFPYMIKSAQILDDNTLILNYYIETQNKYNLSLFDLNKKEIIHDFDNIKNSCFSTIKLIDKENFITLDDNRFISYWNNCLKKVTNEENFYEKFEFQENIVVNKVKSIFLVNNKIIFKKYSNIEIWDIKEGKFLDKLSGGSFCISEDQKTLLISSNSDFNFTFYDLEKLKIIGVYYKLLDADFIWNIPKTNTCEYEYFYTNRKDLISVENIDSYKQVEQKLSNKYIEFLNNKAILEKSIYGGI